MGQLVFQATLGGQVNLVGPNTASTFNLNVPAVSSTIASLAAQTFAGAQTFTLDASISGLTVGKGGGAVASNTVVGLSALASNSTGAFNATFGSYAGTNTTSSNNAFLVMRLGKLIQAVVTTQVQVLTLYTKTAQVQTMWLSVMLL